LLQAAGAAGEPAQSPREAGAVMVKNPRLKDRTTPRVHTFSPPPQDDRHPLNGAGLIDALEKAETIEEWNDGIGHLFFFLFLCARQEILDPATIVWGEKIRAFIARGFEPPKHRPKQILRAEKDAAYLARLYGNPPALYFQDAVDAIRAHEKIPFDKDIRERVRRAEAVLGWKLKRGKRKD
jgi:hypothetical protein